MRNQVPDFIGDADNVYRTDCYIVKQVVRVVMSDSETSAICSYDTYYLRTPERDLLYKLCFSRRRHIDGKRLPTPMYTLKYID